MKTLVIGAAAALITALLLAPPAGADPSRPWCEWSPELDTHSCDFIVGVPPTGQLIEGPGDWSQPEIRTTG
ncbi:Uncharacterised protein [Mycobacteroides abscessus subsp. abscessus]|uniref:hypothetical protein n=1 Tax=Mycobacteroides abscessus TaxID=36809 RepID=UPI0005E3F518|nr:hypothetical protein [Mycobacteroides abscessus]MBN7556748.1 hypothetical protein [Mycobacteroides abscessus subsp. abscessus]MBN7564504.1 hypothetical protein [Mycobacteroides abscessus subsp. massiliense]MDO3011346.1 hypothetical protein [Mycobacteroides abscessus subsp. abscessus]MDO3046595.1 hypothetical protein [Mycobacteroides abscessus subsp. abscessus]MDO3137398.1 hypothetical protein [Mycobacteroides abscessus subsp. abscessus]